MSYFQPQNQNAPNYIQQPINQPVDQKQQQQVPVYQQNQVYPLNQGYYQNQNGSYPPSQGGYLQNQGYHIQQGSPAQPVYPIQQGNYPLIVNQQASHFGLNVSHSIAIIGNNLCPYCGRPFSLVVGRRIGWQTILAFLLLLFIFWPLCWLPFVIKDCKDKHYFCSQCGHLIQKKEFTMCN